MNIDLKSSLLFPFRSAGWFKKLLFAWIFIFLPITLIINITYYDYYATLYLALTMLFQFSFSFGYMIQSAHNVIKDEDAVLPSWTNNFINYFSIGLQYLIVLFLYSLPFIMFIMAIYIWNSLQNWSEFIQFAPAFIALMILFLAFVIIIPFVAALFAENFNFKDAFRLRKIINIISKHPAKYLAISGASSMLWILVILFKSTFYNNFAGIVILAFSILYLQFITLNIFAQIYKTEGQIKL